MSRQTKRRLRLRGPRSLRMQLLSRSLIVLAVLLILIGMLQYVWMKNAMLQNQAEALALQLRSIPRELWDPDLGNASRHAIPGPGAGNTEDGMTGGSKDAADNAGKGWTSPPRSERPLMFLPNMSLARIETNGSHADLSSDSSGRSAPKLSSDAYGQILQKFKEHRPVKYKIVDDADDNEQLIVFRPLGTPGSPTGLLQLGIDTDALHAVLMRQLIIFALLAFLAMAGGVALYLPLLRRTLLPLNRIVDAVRRTDAGNLAERFPASQGQQEIDRLAESFNGMLERLEHAFEAEREAKEHMRRFIADASHELRTPLTSIHGFLEVLLRGAADHPEQLHAALSSMHGESRRMKKLVEDLLLLAKLDQRPKLQVQHARLDLLLREMEPHLRMLAQNRAAAFQTLPVQGRCDPDKLKQVIYNLFQNAVQHTDPSDGSITVALKQQGDRAVLIVSDNGPGIAEEHLPHLFERFYRIDRSRARIQGGAGLGLAIAHSIMTAHGGSLTVASTLGKGTAFRAEWPAE